MAAASRLRSLLWPAVFAAIGCAILIGLGVWQVERLHWKEALLAEIDARIHAPPEPLPPPDVWPRLVPDDYEYRHVRATGVFEHDKETYVFRTGALRGAQTTAGFHVLTPLRLADGTHVLVNRGFVPQDRRDPATRRDGEIAGEVTVTGLMRAPEGRNWFTPSDDVAHRIWYARDPAAVAAALGIARLAPFAIDADAAPVPGGLPQGGATEIAIPNDHLSYALTWFGLAATLVGVFAAFAWRRLRETPAA
jgi:surfeit locus 1 family protein